MKIFYHTLNFKTVSIFQFVRVDKEIQQVVERSSVQNGFVLSRSPHNTAALVCNEGGEDVLADIKSIIERDFPLDQEWKHAPKHGKENARAHVAATLVGKGFWAPIVGGKMQMGPDQAIFIVELFQPRDRQVDIMIVGQ